MNNPVHNKLKSTSGESIAETLVAVLISAFALLMLAGTVNTASNLITKGQVSLENYYEAMNNLADHSAGESDMSVQITGYGVNQSESVTGYSLTGSDSQMIGSKNIVAYSLNE